MQGLALPLIGDDAGDQGRCQGECQDELSDRDPAERRKGKPFDLCATKAHPASRPARPHE